MSELLDHFGARTRLPGDDHFYYRLNKLQEDGIAQIERLPFSIKVLLEAVLRTCDGYQVRPEDVTRLAKWGMGDNVRSELPFKPGRVILQDFTGLPVVVDLASMRAAMARLGGDPEADAGILHGTRKNLGGSDLYLLDPDERGALRCALAP